MQITQRTFLRTRWLLCSLGRARATRRRPEERGNLKRFGLIFLSASLDRQQSSVHFQFSSVHRSALESTQTHSMGPHPIVLLVAPLIIAFANAAKLVESPSFLDQTDEYPDLTEEATHICGADWVTPKSEFGDGDKNFVYCYHNLREQNAGTQIRIPALYSKYGIYAIHTNSIPEFDYYTSTE